MQQIPDQKMATFMQGFRSRSVSGEDRDVVRGRGPDLGTKTNGKRKLTVVGRIFRKAAGRLPAPFARPFGRPVAVFFHGVERGIFDPPLQENHHALEDFHSIAAAIKTNFNVAPLSELSDAIAHPERHRRTVFLMSDDGYANTLHTAADILQDLRLPWTLFVSTEHIDTGECNPMFLARLFLHRAPDGAYDLPHLQGPLRLNGSRDEATAGMLRHFRALSGQQARQVVADMVSVLNDSAPHLLEEYASERFLDWDGVRALARRNVMIGAHAHWHWALQKNEDADAVRFQAEEPRRRVEAELGVACQHFAYPFGNRNDVSGAAWRAVRDAGYSHAFTTMSGTLDAGQNPWLLPRYGLAMQERNLAGVLPLLGLANWRLTRWQASLH